MENIDLLKRRLDREQRARQQAERVLEDKAWELHTANQQLKFLNENLAQQVEQGIAELKEKDARFRELIDSVQDIIYRISPEGFFTFMNPMIEVKLGYTASEIIGQHFIRLIRPDFRTLVINFYQQMLADGQDSSYVEFPVLTKAGQTVWIGQTVRRLDGETGTELVAVARDITSEREIREALRATQNRLASLIINLQKGVLVEDGEGRITLVNQLFCDLFSIPLTPEDLLDMDSALIVSRMKHHFVDADQFEQNTRQIQANQQMVLDQTLYQTNGRVLERDFIPIVEEGRYEGHLWKYGDVTEQHLSREATRKNEEKYRGILNTMDIGLIELNRDRTIQRAYDRFCTMTGYTEAQLIGRPIDELIVSNENGESEPPTSVLHAGEQQMIRRDDQRIWVIVSEVPQLSENSEIIGTIAVYYDITQRKLLEQELGKAQEIAEEARQAEKQFLANMSHEIRTPLNAIIGMAHLLFDTRPTRQQLEYLEILKTSSDFLYSLISDLLDMAKIEAGRIDVHKQPFDLVGLLRTIQRVFQIKLEQRPIDLELMVDAQIGGNYVGDELLLNQILLNLIGNAEKFTEEGHIDIGVRLKKEENDVSWVEFSVQDTGIGIPAEKIDLIFQKFKQVNANGHKQKGTGLGLAITHQLVELQGGTIAVVSTEGQGTTFTVTLPFQRSDVAPIVYPRQIQPVPTDLTDCRLLVAEDNIMNQKYISSLLDKWAISFVIASDGKRAVEMAQQQHFDLILMDIQMPVMDGYEATITIRNTQNINQQTPIVALTASAMTDQKAKASRVGMTDFITKPFSPNNLLEAIQRHTHTNAKATADEVLPPVAAELDQHRLDEIYGSDRSYAADMFEVFLSDVLPEFTHIQDLILEKDWPSLGRLAHKLKPTLGMVGLTTLEKKLHSIEKQANDAPDQHELQTQWTSVQAELDRSVPIVKQELARLSV
ncbi:PAS domain-containing hybrid sensor histidine kinase/response regulator [Spirosoma rhododendri]|uniref:histidine kinase n=1 Tax=Spirosoma rhododendri TaxID=2728024 RepID=A0A7L5DLS8_9BACT|nr:PAS domain S-box protein [Spirosoma rhododendri]QJD79434.1 PAS domain S-box protein [Spirosoma rhododendri]